MITTMLTSFDNNSGSDGGCQNHNGGKSGTGYYDNFADNGV